MIRSIQEKWKWDVDALPDVEFVRIGDVAHDHCYQVEIFTGLPTITVIMVVVVIMVMMLVAVVIMSFVLSKYRSGDQGQSQGKCKMN